MRLIRVHYVHIAPQNNVVYYFQLRNLTIQYVETSVVIFLQLC